MAEQRRRAAARADDRAPDTTTTPAPENTPPAAANESDSQPSASAADTDGRAAAAAAAPPSTSDGDDSPRSAPSVPRGATTAAQTTRRAPEVIDDDQDVEEEEAKPDPRSHVHVVTPSATRGAPDATHRPGSRAPAEGYDEVIVGEHPVGEDEARAFARLLGFSREKMNALRAVFDDLLSRAGQEPEVEAGETLERRVELYPINHEATENADLDYLADLIDVDVDEIAALVIRQDQNIQRRWRGARYVRVVLHNGHKATAEIPE